MKQDTTTQTPEDPILNILVPFGLEFNSYGDKQKQKEIYDETERKIKEYAQLYHASERQKEIAEAGKELKFSPKEVFEWLQSKNYQTDYGQQEYKMYFDVDMPKILNEFIQEQASALLAARDAEIKHKDEIIAGQLESIAQGNIERQKLRFEIRDLFTAEEVREKEKAYCDYIQLLGEELDSLVPIAHSHGWRSTRHQKGIELRKAISDLNCPLPDLEKKGGKE